jgi:hypothetical protein
VTNVLCAYNNTHAAPGDYSALNTQLVFTNGQMTGDVVCASLDIINDNVVENNEELLTVTLSADDPPVTTLTATSATIDIRENDNDGNKRADRRVSQYRASNDLLKAVH